MVKSRGIFFHIFELVLLTLTAWLTAACGSSVTPAPSSTSSLNSLLSSSGPISLTAASTTVSAGGTDQLYAQGGSGTYYYAVIYGSGSVNTSGLFTASSNDGVVEIEVEDTFGDTAYAEVAVGEGTTDSALSLSPDNETLTYGQTIQLTPSGGTGTYLYYDVIEGEGTVTSTGLYTAPDSISSVEIEVVDSGYNIAFADFTVGTSSTTGGTVSSTETYVICTTAQDCSLLAGTDHELDGQTASAAQINADALCISEGHNNQATYETTSESVDCIENYDLTNWSVSASKFVVSGYSCKSALTVVSSVTCQ